MTKHEEAMKRLEEILWPERKSFAARLDEAIERQRPRHFNLRKAARRWDCEARMVLHGVFEVKGS